MKCEFCKFLKKFEKFDVFAAETRMWRVKLIYDTSYLQIELVVCLQKQVAGFLGNGWKMERIDGYLEQMMSRCLPRGLGTSW